MNANFHNFGFYFFSRRYPYLPSSPTKLDLSPSHFLRGGNELKFCTSWLAARVLLGRELTHSCGTRPKCSSSWRWTLSRQGTGNCALKENSTDAGSLVFRRVTAKGTWKARGRRSRRVCAAGGQKQYSKVLTATVHSPALVPLQDLLAWPPPPAHQPAPLHFCRPWPKPWVWTGSGIENLGF